MENNLGVHEPIVRSVTFPVDDPRAIADCFSAGIPEGFFIYSRFGHPNHRSLELALADLEKGEDARLFGSGMAASAALLLGLLSPGDRIIVSRYLYGGTRAQVEALKQKLRLKVSVIDPADDQDVARALRSKSRLFLVESISNPEVVVAPLRMIASRIAASRYRPVLCVDNTFAPGVIFPIVHGADIVLHSLTKFMSGRSDLMGGALVGKKELLAAITHPTQGSIPLLGAVLHPPLAVELRDRMEDLNAHVSEACERASWLAHTLLKSTNVPISVCYPTIGGRAGALVQVDAQSGGAVLSGGFPDEATGLAFVEHVTNARWVLRGKEVPLAYSAVSLGSSHTYLWCFTKARVEKLRDLTPIPFAPIPHGFVRIAVGYEGKTKDWKRAWEIALSTFTHNTQS